MQHVAFTFVLMAASLFTPHAVAAQTHDFRPAHIDAVLQLLPTDARADARVLVRTEGGLEEVRRGSNEWTCWVERFGDRMGGNCHHTVLDAFLQRKRGLNSDPVEGETTNETLAREYNMGLIWFPDASMEMSGYGPMTEGGGPPEVLSGRFFLYFPFMTADELGVPGEEPYPGGPWLHHGGTIQSHIMWSRDVEVQRSDGM